jgi:hypothetical protein
LPSVESLIALEGKQSNSESGVPELGRRAVTPRRSATNSAAIGAFLPAAGRETVTIRSFDVSVICRTHEPEGIMLACINNPGL